MHCRHRAAAQGDTHTCGDAWHGHQTPLQEWGGGGDMATSCTSPLHGWLCRADVPQQRGQMSHAGGGKSNAIAPRMGKRFKGGGGGGKRGSPGLSGDGVRARRQQLPV